MDGDHDDSEIKNLLKVLILLITSLTYCYLISSRVPKGLTRLLTLLPIIYLLTFLPLNFSTFHLTAVSSVFISWLANFKLLLFAFDQPPLSSLTNLVFDQPPLSSLTNLVHFILVASLPIKIKPHNPSHQKSQQELPNRPINLKPILLIVKLVILVALFQVYDYKEHLSQYMVLGLYCFHLYLELELILAIAATPARFLGFELEPQFDEPYLTTSLQDFWGYKWNLMVPSILRPTVYFPIRGIFIRIVGKDGARLLGVIATFVVSGLMHELVYYNMARVPPTWEVTWFFVLQGVCVAIEMVIKKVVADRWRLHRAVSGPLTLGFVAGTGFWLFYPQILKNKLDERALGELSILRDYIKGIVKYE